MTSQEVVHRPSELERACPVGPVVESSVGGHRPSPVSLSSVDGKLTSRLPVRGAHPPLCPNTEAARQREGTGGTEAGSLHAVVSGHAFTESVGLLGPRSGL